MPATRQPKGFNCPTCGDGFGRPLDVERHKWTHHRDPDSLYAKAFLCPGPCNKVFMRKDALTRHLRNKGNACSKLRQNLNALISPPGVATLQQGIIARTTTPISDFFTSSEETSSPAGSFIPSPVAANSSEAVFSAHAEYPSHLSQMNGARHSPNFPSSGPTFEWPAHRPLQPSLSATLNVGPIVNGDAGLAVTSATANLPAHPGQGMASIANPSRPFHWGTTLPAAPLAAHVPSQRALQPYSSMFPNNSAWQRPIAGGAYTTPLLQGPPLGSLPPWNGSFPHEQVRGNAGHPFFAQDTSLQVPQNESFPSLTPGLLPSASTGWSSQHASPGPVWSQTPVGYNARLNGESRSGLLPLIIVTTIRPRSHSGARWDFPTPLAVYLPVTATSRTPLTTSRTSSPRCPPTLFLRILVIQRTASTSLGTTFRRASRFPAPPTTYRTTKTGL